MDNRWYSRHLNDVKKKAGVRYTPELNIDLPISEIFDGISRTEHFYLTIREKYGELPRELNYVTSQYSDRELQDIYDELKKEIKTLFDLIGNIKHYTTEPIPWENIRKQSKVIEGVLWTFIEKLRKAKDQVKDVKFAPRKDGSYQASPSEKFSSNLNHIYKIKETIRHFVDFSSSTKAQLSNNPFLILTGSAGTGKTHLLCDVLEQRLIKTAKPLPTFLVFGEYFTNEKHFWKQVLEQLDFETKIGTKNKFLEQLNYLGKVAKCRSLLIIDALNENISRAPNFWKNNFNRIIKEIKKYPNIALIVSIRSGFEDEVLTYGQRSNFVREEHLGFHFKEWEAVNKFFNAFSLPLPEVPLLMPEFQNPLFLILFCKAFTKRNIKNKGKQIFRGHEGATYIFENFVDTVSRRIEDNFKIDHGPKKNIWDTIIEKIAEEMVNHNEDKILEEKLIQIIQKAYPNIDTGTFLSALEGNMLLVKVPHSSGGEREKVFDIRFPFQKFSDHLIGRYIFKRYETEFGKSNKNLHTARKFFSKKRKLGKFLSKSWNRGVLEALSVQCPEQLKGIEFIEVAPYLMKEDYVTQAVEEAFVESLIWRNPNAFSKTGKNTLKIINENIIKTEPGHTSLLNAFLSITPIPNHLFNAYHLHSHLSRLSLANRDSWWSTFLHYQHGEHGAVDRLLEWAWSDHKKSHLNDESIILTSIALSWFLATPDRIVRDKATKGLVCLLQERIYLLPQLLKNFFRVNDPYIVERLFAVAYGCVLRNKEDKKNLKVIAEWIYEELFKSNKLPLHILLRDYARGVIEVAFRRGIKFKNRMININPPYKSDWPENIPSEEDLKKQYYPEDFINDRTNNRGFIDIWVSVLGMGDFARYVIGTNGGGIFAWSSRKLRSLEPNRKSLLEDFKNGLTSKQKELLEKATYPFFGLDSSEIHKQIKVIFLESEETLSELEIEKHKAEEIEMLAKNEQALIEFYESISEDKKAFFQKEIKPFLDGRGGVKDPLDHFDLKQAQRWIFNRVVKLGYDPKLHGKFDEMVGHYDSGRSEHKPERIGKKYQWIAFYEFMALISDHFEFKGNSWSDSVEKYKGPWNPRMRDLDPTFILKSDIELKQSFPFSNWRANQGYYDAWEKAKSDLDWIKTENDLPKPENIIQINDDYQNEWLMFEGFLKWEEKTPPEFKKYDIPLREFWYMIKSYIVKKNDADNFFNWAKQQNFYGRWMPESHIFYETFIGEYPNSLAFEDLRGDYNIWTKSGRDTGALPIKVVVTDDIYLNEFTLDCSLTGKAIIKLPCKWLVNKMELDHKYLDGRWFDKKGALVAFATNIFKEGFPSALIFKKRALIDFLTKNGYAIFWTLLGEKQLLGGSLAREKYCGRLEISGVYGINENNEIIGTEKMSFNK